MNREVGILNQVDKSPNPERVYGRWFLSAYVSNTTLMLAVNRPPDIAWACPGIRRRLEVLVDLTLEPGC